MNADAVLISIFVPAGTYYHRGYTNNPFSSGFGFNNSYRDASEQDDCTKLCVSASIVTRGEKKEIYLLSSRRHINPH